MNKIILKQQLKKHLSLTSSDEIQSVCKPLKDHLKVKSLVYKSICNDGRETVLTTHPEWIEYYFNHGLYKKSALEKEPSNYVKGELLWANIETHSEILDVTREGFDIDNGISLIRPYNNGCEFYYFGASRNNYNAKQLLSNNIDLLDKFTHYFKAQLSSVLDKAHAYPLIIQNKFKENIIPVEKIPCYQNQAMRNAFLNELSQNGMDLYYNNKYIHLTRREYKVAKESLKGRTMQQIADNLFISRRTVETHIDNIKMKFLVHKKSDLLLILSTFNL